MTLTLELSEPVQRQLAERATNAGKTIETFACELIEQAVGFAKEKTFAEIAAPFAQEFAESGMTEEEWDAMIEKARQEVWEEKHGKRT